MQHRRQSPTTDRSPPEPHDGRAITGVLLELTTTGSKLFRNDEDAIHDGLVPSGLLFKAKGHETRFYSSSPTITEMYAALNALHTLDEGPAPQALSAPALQVADDTSDPAYPPFFRVTASYGFSSILSVPLNLGNAAESQQ